MNKKILSISIGYNHKNLFGSENDSILFFNTFYKFYSKDDCWLKPRILNNKMSKMDEVIKIITNSSSFDILIIYFSGHGYLNNIRFYNENISKNKFYNLINESLKSDINLILILDCCYSESFYKEQKNNKIKYLNLFSSCRYFEKSNEGIVNYNKNLFKYLKPNIIENSKIVLGIFSYNLCKLLYKKKKFDLNYFLNINNIIIWKIIEKKFNQKFIII